MQFEQPQKKYTLNQKQIKIPDIEKNLVKTYSSSEKLFDPSLLYKLLHYGTKQYSFGSKNRQDTR